MNAANETATVMPYLNALLTHICIVTQSQCSFYEYLTINILQHQLGLVDYFKWINRWHWFVSAGNFLDSHPWEYISFLQSRSENHINVTSKLAWNSFITDILGSVALSSKLVPLSNYLLNLSWILGGKFLFAEFLSLAINWLCETDHMAGFHFVLNFI